MCFTCQLDISPRGIQCPNPGRCEAKVGNLKGNDNTQILETRQTALLSQVSCIFPDMQIPAINQHGLVALLEDREWGKTGYGWIQLKAQ